MDRPLTSTDRPTAGASGTLVDLLAARAGSGHGYKFLPEGPAIAGHPPAAGLLSFAALDRAARAIGAELIGRGLTGDRVLLMYPYGPEYVTAFFGCLYAGVLAVPVFPPDPARPATVARLAAVVADAAPAVGLTTAAVLPLAKALAGRDEAGWAVETSGHPGPAGEAGSALGHLDWLATDTIPAEAGDAWRRPAITPDSTAFIQYTSGSTAAPRGVVLSHGNLLHNSALIQHAFGTTQASYALSWLPLYHDMGLIGGILQPLYADFPMALMSPLAFLSRPMSWLQAISGHRITISGGPNFAYDLCVRKYDDQGAAGLDLSAWAVAFNGAEPVRAATLDRFAATFGPHGFHRDAFLPCYGLAESTLIVTGKLAGGQVRQERVAAAGLATGAAGPARGGAAAVDLVGSGCPLPGQRVAVTDPQTGEPLPDRAVGEIRVAGPSVARGYWGPPRRSAAAFVATGPGERWLRTGDLGFLADGELFVTGRLKDLIIVRGRNIYPQDLEQAAVESGVGLRPGRVVAFGAEQDGDERVVLVAEPAAGLEAAAAGAVAAQVRRAVSEAQDAEVHEVLLVPPGTITKTSSGKPQRYACRAAYLAGELAPMGRSVAGEAPRPRPAVTGIRDLPAGPRRERVLGYLRDLLAAAIGVDPQSVAADRELASLGLDSLASVEALHRIETGFGVELPVAALLPAGSLAELADLVCAGLDAAAAPGASSGQAPAAQAPVPPAGDGTPDGAGGGDQPVTENQRALWFIQQLDPESRAYNLARAFTVQRGTLDPGALDGALRLLVSRHVALRTRFVNREGEPRAVLTPVPEPLLEVIRVPATALPARLAEESWRPFDLTAAAPFRAVLLEPDSGPPVLLVTAHHIALDLWSLTILIDELCRAYPALTVGAPVPLREAVPYTEYAWHQAALLAADGPRLSAYWREQLAGELPVLELPDLRPRPAVQTHRGAAWRQELATGLSQRIQALAAASGTTRYLVLLTALQAVLHRYTGQDDILIGTAVADRRQAAFATTVGYLLNTVLLRADLSGNPAFEELLAQNKATLDDALAYRAYPFARLAAAGADGRDPSRPPLAQVMLTLEQVPRSMAPPGLGGLAIDEPGVRLDLGGVTLTSRPLPHRSAGVDLTLRVAEAGGSLIASWEYNTDVLTSPLVAQFGRHLVAVLEQATEEPGRRVGDLSLLTPAEPASLHRWPEDSAPVPAGRGMHELILDRAAARPEAIAVRAGEASLSYACLAGQAAVLAARLRGMGIGPEARVGVYLLRSPEAIVAILAVLMAGGAYLPVDPEAPAERAGLILRDARVAAVLSHTALRWRLPDCAAPTVWVDEVLSGAPPPADHPGWPADPAATAYVLYTSGSTGRPKGIQVSHANLVWSTHVRLGYFPDRVSSFLLISSLGFDSSVAGLFWTLYEGGTLVLPDPAREQDPVHHRELLARHAVSHFESVPSLYRQLLRLLEPGELPALRSVVVAGEACPREVADAHRAVLPHAKLVNEYGPTEATVWGTAYRAGPGLDRGYLPIGRPLPGAASYLLDRYGHPVPPGVVGEIHIGGGGVARGYLGRPGMTAGQFLPDPFSARPGARMYRTGDLARLLPDGDLEFAGRADRQLKIHGVRIEIGEVEAALRACPGVVEATVQVVTSPAGQDVLAAYLVPDIPRARTPDQELRASLLERLSPAMVPSVFAWIDELPLTPHGKLDEQALPAALPAAPQAGGAAPATPVAQVLAGICADLLDLPRMGLDDDFFACGGHSLLVTQLVARARAALGVEIPARTVFTSPTVAQLAEAVERELAGPGHERVPPPRPAAADGPVPLSYSQQRLWFIDQLLPGSAAYNIPIAVRIRGPLDRGALVASLDAVVRRHEALRTTFELTDQGPIQRIHDPAPLTLDVVDPAARPGSLTEQLAAAASRPFDLAAGPLIRASLYRLGASEHVLLLVLHHIVADGWSLAVLTDEVAMSYEACVQGTADPVAAPALQYRDYAAWQRDQLSAATLSGQLDYWTRQLAGVPSLRLPADRPRPVVAAFSGATQPWRLDAAAVVGLREVSRGTDSTLFMVLLAALGLLLSGHSYADEVVIGTPISGRTHLETEDLIGFFANTLALRLDTSGDPSFEDLVRRTRDVCVEAYMHQDVPFELLVETLQPSRDLAKNPLFQVLFALQNAPRSTPRLTGLELELMEVTTGTAKFDLTISLWEAGEGLLGFFEYDRDLFDQQTVAALAAEYAALLRKVAGNAAAPLSALFAAGQDGQARQDTAAPGPAGEPPPEIPVYRLFAGQAEQAPDAPAVRQDGAVVTYGELAARVSARAAGLARRGAGPGTLVGLVTAPPLERVTGLLAILATGAAFVPMDHRRPVWWHDQVLRDAGPALLLDSGEITTGPARRHPAVTAETACVCYPEDGAAGVVTGHQALAARIRMMRAELGIGGHDRVSGQAPAWTEQAAWEVLLALTAGATLLLPRAADGFPAGAGAPLPSVVLADPASLPGLAGAAPAGTRLLCVGEQPPQPAELPATLLFQPTAPLAPVATVWTCDSAGRWDGRPLDAVQVALLDRFGSPAGTGVPGHLHVTGPALATGYLGRPDLTESALLPVPADGDRRWHPTGTLAWRRRDGRIEWLGPLHPSDDEPDGDVPFVAPRTGVERVIATVWSDLLDTSPIGVDDDFFRLGGHSLLAMQIITHMRAIFQVEVAVQRFFEQPTVAGIAKAVEALEPGPGQAEQIAGIWARVKGLTASPTT